MLIRVNTNLQSNAVISYRHCFTLWITSHRLNNYTAIVVYHKGLDKSDVALLISLKLRITELMLNMSLLIYKSMF